MQSTDTRGLNFCSNSSALTATGAETVHDTTVALNFCVNGKALSKSGTNADQVTPTTDHNTGAAFNVLTANKACVMVWAYTAGGVVKCMQGPVVDYDGTNYSPMPQFASIPDNVTPFAYQVLKAGSTAGTITFGTSNWNATGFTNAIVNVMTLPEHPQTS